nr:MAG: replication initiator protein [Microviridae sp.]
MCLYPKLIKNRKYIPNKKNHGHPPIPTDDRLLYVSVGCQKCMECMKQKKRNWQVRLQEEIKNNINGQFVTLTFSNESINELKKNILINKIDSDYDNAIATLAVRRFLERWRKKYKVSVKHWLVTELGHQNTERIHLHGIIFLKNIEQKKEIQTLWNYGQIWIGQYVNEKTINYIVKYINKLDSDHKGYIPKILCSKGIGNNFLNRYDSKINVYQEDKTKEYYKTKQGNKLMLPIYYRNKIYTEDEREKLWLQKLDKEERYVCGEKVSIKKDDKSYINLREYYRNKNKRLGYGDDSKIWSNQEYQKQRDLFRALTEYNKIKINKIKEQEITKDNTFGTHKKLEDQFEKGGKT